MSKKFAFKIDSEYLDLILSERKTIEVRLAKDKYLKLSPGDIIEFNDCIYKFKILEVKKYISFQELLTIEGIENVMPNTNSMKEAILKYHKIYSYENENKYGVLAFRIKKMIE